MILYCFYNPGVDPRRRSKRRLGISVICILVCLVQQLFERIYGLVTVSATYANSAMV